MASGPPANRSNGVPQLSEDTVRELLSVQKQELSIRLKEIERDNAEIGFNKSVAQQSIDAQERDRKHEREERTKRQKTHQNFVLLAIALVLAFAFGAMYLGHAALVLDIVKVVVGFVGGMGYWAFRQRRSGSGEDD